MNSTLKLIRQFEVLYIKINDSDNAFNVRSLKSMYKASTKYLCKEPEADLSNNIDFIVIPKYISYSVVLGVLQ